MKDEEIGKCECCKAKVFMSDLFVEEDGVVYHYSCYNYKKAEEEDNK